MFCYIKDGELVTTSPQLIEKRQDEVLGEIQEDGSQEIITPFVDGMVYDQVIETEITDRVCYENGRIIAWELSEEKKADDLKIEQERIEQEAEKEKMRPGQIIEELGELKRKKDGLELLGEDTTEIDAQITALKIEYKNIK